MSKWNAILFDLDDTLFAERQFVLSGFHAASELVEQTLEIPAAQAFRELTSIFDTGPRDRVFDRWLNQHRCHDDILLGRLIDTYRNHPPTIWLRDGMRALLALLSKNAHLGLVSDGILDVQRRKFAALDVSRHFKSVVFSDRWGRAFWKPHVLPFQTALAELGTAAAQAVYVADNPHKDFLGCRSLGMATIRLRMPDGIYADASAMTPEHQPDYTVLSVRELRDFLSTQQIS